MGFIAAPVTQHNGVRVQHDDVMRTYYLHILGSLYIVSGGHWKNCGVKVQVEGRIPM